VKERQISGNASCVLVLCIAHYYVIATHRKLTALIRATVHARLFVCGCIVLMALSGVAPLAHWSRHAGVRAGWSKN
jgi:hypothetical protein